MEAKKDMTRGCGGRERELLMFGKDNVRKSGRPNSHRIVVPKEEKEDV